MSWVNDKFGKIYSIIEYRTTQKLGTKYSDLFFTDDSENNITSSFPTVFLHYLPTKEVGHDLENNAINGVMCSVEIEVTVSNAQGKLVADEVIWEILDQYKKLGFNIIMTPELIATGNSTKRVIARVRRVIGANDEVG